MGSEHHLSRRQLFAITAAGAGTVAFADFAGILDATPASASTIWCHPFTKRGNITSPYGPNKLYRDGVHKGIDYSPPLSGTPIYSIGPGVVEYIEIEYRNGSYGRYELGTQVTIVHPGGWRSTYAHMQALSVAVEINQRVAMSQIIGTVGNTGSSGGAHLHIEMWTTANRSDHTNPYNHIHEAPLAGTIPPEPPMPIYNDQEDELSYKYIWNGIAHPNPAARYAVISVVFNNGYIESPQIADARAFSGLAPMPGSPHQMTNEAFTATIALAQIARASYLAIHNPSA